MKNIELKLVSELMKNSRRSDRQLAKVLGVSQPTVSRMIRRLEDEGIIREYTMIPDFKKLGYNIMAVIFVKHKAKTSPKAFAEAQRKGLQRLRSGESPEIVMAERGVGLGWDTMLLAYTRNYSEYAKLVQSAKRYQHLEMDEVESFIVNLSDDIHYREFSYSTLANHLLTVQYRAAK
jgi:DNA-binding Lrp family transcriptional regulator